MEDQEGDSPIKSVRKAIEVLEAVANARRPLRIGEISAKLGMSQSAVSRIVATLSKAEMIYQDDESGRCYPGLGLAVLGACALGRRNLDRIAGPIMDEIAARTGFYVGLGRLSKGKVVVMRSLPTPMMQRDVALTVVAPIHACAPGKILASGMTDSAVATLLVTYGMDPITTKTITEPQLFLEVVEAVRQNGFALDEEEGGHNYMHVAVPIMDHNGDIVASLSAGGVLAQVVEGDLAGLLQALNHGALRISRELDYPGELPINVEALRKEVVKAG